MHTDRFVVFKFQDEWLVTYADREQSAFATRQDAERSAFDAADTLASHGHAVSVLIIPDATGDISKSCLSDMRPEKKSLN
ncbi:hypothetical protein [Microvirga mediterraneensis]|uniref:DUF2188 domain-containing protein n=1 Tax=Microvirga mediterraneensis TaxID=2754695 RepID=A0A838BRX4_9HYPH|nr:hypothetical protein [Microvirga mediterraneensis]MBA1157735.1 hypothetical protein [Microvirga mediterraneensis]